MLANFKNILVTGGSGFIGSNFIRYIYNTHPSYRIVNLDLLTYAGNPDNLIDIETQEAGIPKRQKRYIFVHGDICDTELLDKIFSKYEFRLVINFAAESHVDRSIIDATDFIHTNIFGVKMLSEAVRKYNVPRFVHISTDEVYGSIEKGRATESYPLRPSNPYSASKAAAELIIQAFQRTHNIPAIIVRGSNNYGPYQYPEKLIPLAISNIIEGKKIPVHGDGRHIRSWLHVNDFCRAINLIAHEAPLYETYNVSGEERTNLEILTVVASEFGVKLDDKKDHVNDRPGADLRYAPDCSKFKLAFGWKPRYDFRSSVADLVQWYIKNQEWWKKIKSKSAYRDHYDKQASGIWF